MLDLPIYQIKFIASQSRKDLSSLLWLLVGSYCITVISIKILIVTLKCHRLLIFLKRALSMKLRVKNLVFLPHLILLLNNAVIVVTSLLWTINLFFCWCHSTMDVIMIHYSNGFFSMFCHSSSTCLILGNKIFCFFFPRMRQVTLILN